MFPILLAILEEQKQLYSDFEKEAIPHIDALYNFALKMSGSSSDANILLQETYLRAFRFFDKLEKETNCKSWLFRIMKNTFIDSYKKQTKEPDPDWIGIDYEEVESFYENIKSSSPGRAYFEKEIFDNLLDDDISEAIYSLPEDFKTVVTLCDIEGFSYEEIADFVDCPIGTVRSRLHRARKMLFTKLYKYADDKGYVYKRKI